MSIILHGRKTTSSSQRRVTTSLRYFCPRPLDVLQIENLGGTVAAYERKADFTSRCLLA